MMVLFFQFRVTWRDTIDETVIIIFVRFNHHDRGLSSVVWGGLATI